MVEIDMYSDALNNDLLVINVYRHKGRRLGQGGCSPPSGADIRFTRANLFKEQ